MILIERNREIDVREWAGSTEEEFNQFVDDFLKNLKEKYNVSFEIKELVHEMRTGFKVGVIILKSNKIILIKDGDFLCYDIINQDLFSIKEFEKKLYWENKKEI